ncbi:acyltransferase [Paracrocinitomix mangrovi]|uniref:acyltransferase family protein n=1 Tax=Paracrocinitomix mangrovi TaxID=2862509 RepID=UPI001C8E8C07|nr:acyltransferase [Paracrocinitomix mangrovi]UKN00422.1 acyltransferase [Paracrocinitomix mangrovi]
MKKERIFFKNLDIIRFIAAILVLIGHAFGAWKAYFVQFRYSAEYTAELFSGNFIYLETFANNLEIGVEIFFFISGFLITYILLQERKINGKIHVGKFYLRRSLRIWPLYYAAILIAPFLVSWLQLSQEPDYLANALFIGNFDIIQNESWTFPFAHFWSLAIEEQFYIIWPLIIAFLPLKYLKYILISLVLVSIGFRIYIHDMPNMSWHIYLNTLSRMDTLIIGGLIGLIHSSNPIQFKVPKGIIYLIILSLVVFLMMVPTKDFTTLYSGVFQKYVIMLLYGIPVMYFVLNEAEGKGNWLFRKISYLGKISYGIYLFHNILLLVLIDKFFMKYEVYNWFLFWLIYPIVVIVVSVFSFEIFEKQFLKMKERFAVVKTRKF